MTAPLPTHRDPARVKVLAREIAALAEAPRVKELRARAAGLRIMEVCGGQTHAILRDGLESLLPQGVSFLHGPGCPVCVTPAELIRRAIALAHAPEAPLICTYGDLLRVPDDTGGSLAAARAAGAHIQIITSPMQALEAARANPARNVILLAIGFETTAPANALPIRLAAEEGRQNFFALTAQFLIPPILRHIFADAAAAEKPDALLAPGHVAAITGGAPFRALAAELQTPIAITGFEPEDILHGVRAVLAALADAAAPRFANAYSRIVTENGNPAAQSLMHDVFAPADVLWRGLGIIPQSGLVLRGAYAAHDAAHLPILGKNGQHLPILGKPHHLCPSAGKQTVSDVCQPLAKNDEICQSLANPACPAQELLLGKIRPAQCPHFGVACRPEHPLGAPMVSPEGVCAAYAIHRGI